MTVAFDETLPRLSDAVAPMPVLGTAVLATAALNGAEREDLEAMIAEADTDPVARVFDQSLASQLVFRRAEGLGFQDEALAATPLFRIRRDDAKGRLRVLALVAPGDLMVNTPLDFITNHLDVRLDLLYIHRDQPLPAVIPDHDVMFLAVGEADPAFLARLGRLYDTWPRPVLNDPRLLPRLERDALSRALAGVATICSPVATEVARPALDDVVASGAVPPVPYPFLIRPKGSHAGSELKKIDDAAALADYLIYSFAKTYFVTRFVDYRGADGMFRKYRVAFIEREPFLCHMALSQHWMVHYLNAGMAESPAKRWAEAEAMVEFAGGFARRHAASFAELHARLPFDYYSIDCSELPDGRLLVFEADTAAIIHLMDPEDMYPYKQAPMRLVFAAFGAMLERRVNAPAPRTAPA